MCDLSLYISRDDITVVDVMRKIDKNTKGIVFFIDDNGRMIGSLTDGDVRRWLIKSGDLNASVKDILFRSTKYVGVDEIDSANTIMKKYSIRALPVLDRDRCIVDIVFMENDSLKRHSKKGLLKGISTIIMAGGKGTRLHPYTKILPKPLIPIGDIPIIERIMGRLSYGGVKDFYITLNYKKEMIRAYLGEQKYDYRLHYVEEDDFYGTAGSIRLIEENFDKPVFITNCDIIVDADYGDALRFHEESGNMLTIFASLKNVQIPYGVLHSGEQGELRSIDEKPSISFFINTGMYIISPKVIKSIPIGRVYHMTDLIDDLRNRGEKVGMYPISENSFFDMGEFEEMKKMENWVRLNEI